MARPEIHNKLTQFQRISRAYLLLKMMSMMKAIHGRQQMACPAGGNPGAEGDVRLKNLRTLQEGVDVRTPGMDLKNFIIYGCNYPSLTPVEDMQWPSLVLMGKSTHASHACQAGFKSFRSSIVQINVFVKLHPQVAKAYNGYNGDKERKGKCYTAEPACGGSLAEAKCAYTNLANPRTSLQWELTGSRRRCIKKYNMLALQAAVDAQGYNGT
eukprot:1141877-Pelagomonas_calceolata.AAC.4